ncbi:MAG: phytoene/squalene synthase family protein [Beijerinckiaceae bacterium]|nr:phytoene/squalene synthase family protein [Beijerinckiaceae bacterium]
MTDAVAAPHLAPHYEACGQLLRSEDRDRWLACLFAPDAKRPHLHALYAFSLEMARVRELVSEPLPGEIRMQWWRDALCGQGRGDVESHPVASALIDTVKRFRLPVQALKDLIEGRGFDLYDDPMPTLGDLEGYCGETSSALMRLASLVLADGREPGGADAVGHAGVAYAMTGLMRALPWHAARGQLYIPADLLGEYGVTRDDVVSGRATPALHEALADMRGQARRHLIAAHKATASLAPEARAALVPLGLVEPYLALMEKPGYQPFKTTIELPQWRRQWALWKEARRLAH